MNTRDVAVLLVELVVVAARTRPAFERAAEDERLRPGQGSLRKVGIGLSLAFQPHIVTAAAVNVARDMAIGSPVPPNAVVIGRLFQGLVRNHCRVDEAV